MYIGILSSYAVLLYGLPYCRIIVSLRTVTLKQLNIMICSKCGTEVAENDVFCRVCGCALKEGHACGTTHPVSPKSRLVAAILAWYLGIFGVHRFYAGRIVSGIFMILTFGGLGLWALVDAIVILCGEFKDSDGLKIKTWID